jgi:hypothetical protein
MISHLFFYACNDWMLRFYNLAKNIYESRENQAKHLNQVTLTSEYKSLIELS